MKQWKAVLERILVLVMLFQIMLGVQYGTLYGPYLGLDVLLYVGWIVLAVGLPFFFYPFVYPRKKGEAPKGKSYVHTPVLVDSGLYAVVRHPQSLGCILLMSASILISQYWSIAILGVIFSVWIYVDAPNDDKRLIEEFGNDYKFYMQKVPRMNFVVGIIRLLRRRRSE